MYIALAIFCTFLSTVLGYFLVQPVALSLMFPIATMGGFILYTLQHLDKFKAEQEETREETRSKEK